MIEINKKWALSASTLNIILLQKTSGTHHRSKGEGRWGEYGYYNSIHDALDELVKQEVRDTELVTLKAVDDKIAELHTLIRTLPQIKVSDLKRDLEQEEI